jgi:multimeric flavodoxin WrbA
MEVPMEALVLYWSQGGNTEKVAQAIHDGLVDAGVAVTVWRVERAEDVDFFAYDLVCLGFPSYHWTPPEPVIKFLDTKFAAYHRQGRVKVGSPEIPGKKALLFCIYSGPHTGIREAIPAVLRAGQYFEHLGIPVVAEWYMVGEFHGSREASTKGRLGDIRGRPTGEDLAGVKRDAMELARKLQDRVQSP